MAAFSMGSDSNIRNLRSATSYLVRVGQRHFPFLWRPLAKGERLRQAGAVIVSTEMVAFEWLHTCRNEHFKAVLTRLKQG